MGAGAGITAPAADASSDAINTTVAGYTDEQKKILQKGLGLDAAPEDWGAAWTAATPAVQDAIMYMLAYGITEDDKGFCCTKSVNDNISEDWIKAGCGFKEYKCEEKGAVFETTTTGDLPDLSEHNSFLMDFIKSDEGKACWNDNKEKKTALGVTLAKCMKTGIDNKGHPNIKTVGLVGGDEECFTGDFAKLFVQVTRARHGFMEGKHVSDMDVSKLTDTDMDPFNAYVRTARVRTGRSVKGFTLPPSNSFQARRELEKKITDALLLLGKPDSACYKDYSDDEKKALAELFLGHYYPLPGSKSNPQNADMPFPDGMSKEKGEELLAKGNLFQEPDSTLLLSGGMGRHWPDARGIFHNDKESLFVWLNEEDHMRIVSMQGDKKTCTPEGKDMKAVAKRFMDACNLINNLGLDFMKSDELGWILTCPSNCGTGLRAGCQVYLGKVYDLLTEGNTNPKGWKTAMANLSLQARGTGGVDTVATEIFDVSNADRMGKTDVCLVNVCIEGIAFLVLCEHALTKEFEGAKDKVKEALEVAYKKEDGDGTDTYKQLQRGSAKLKELVPELSA
jgi:creatine kinase